MKISKVIRRGVGGSGLNMVVAANVGESDSETSASSRQDIEIIQRDGHTEVRDHTDKEEG